jgi:hypothetical protein
MPSNPFAWLASDAYAYPLLEVAHIVGIALLVGNLTLVELRVWGAGAALPLPALGRFALRVSLAGFALAACSGALMFAANPGDVIANRAFQIKLVLIALAGVNAAAFHLRGGLQRADRTARAQTALSLGLWLAVIICGRWIAYR